MRILAFDPGTTTGVICYDFATSKLLYADELPAADVLGKLSHSVVGYIYDPEDRRLIADAVVHEAYRNYGRPVGPGSQDNIGLGWWLRHAMATEGIDRPDVLRQLGLAGGRMSKAAVWQTTMDVLGQSDAKGKLCPRRKNKSHPPTEDDVFAGYDCDICNGTGWATKPGALAAIRGKTHARDALSAAVAVALRRGLLQEATR